MRGTPESGRNRTGSTLKDVAARAGVSTFTVSRALNNRTGVAPATRDRVIEVANDLSYRPNPFAQSLRRQSSSTISVLTANRQNLFYALLISSLERELRQHGFSFLVTDAVLDGELIADRERQFVSEAVAHKALVALLTYQVAPESLDELIASGIECIFVDVPPTPGYEHLVSVRGDSFAGAKEVAAHLLQHRYGGPWLFVGLPPQWVAVRGRLDGFRAGAKEGGIDVVDIEASNDALRTADSVAVYLAGQLKEGRRLPRAVFTANELILQGTLLALRRFDLRIPLDMAVISYDDFSWAAFVDPPVTVFDQRIPEIARLVSMFISRAAGAEQHDSTTPPGRSELGLFRARTSCGCSFRPSLGAAEQDPTF